MDRIATHDDHRASLSKQDEIVSASFHPAICKDCGGLGVFHWVDPSAYGTHSMRRSKVVLIYRKTGNLRAVQLLLRHTKMDSTVRYLDIETEDALAIAESVEF